MSPEKIIKGQAKHTLRDNNWPAAVGVTLTLAGVIMAAVYFISAIDLAVNSLINSIDFESVLGFNLAEYLGAEDSEITVSLSLYTLIPCALLFIPMLMGAFRYFYLLSKDTDTDYTELFYYYHKGRFFPSMGRFLGIGIRCLWQFLVSFAPGYILYLVAASISYEQDSLDFSAIICYFISYTLLFGGILLFTKLTSKYFLAIYLFIEDESLTASEVCALSVTYTERFRSSVLKLTWSHFPHILSCFLIFPCLFVIPYFMTSLATSAKWMLALYNTEVKDE